MPTIVSTRATVPIFFFFNDTATTEIYTLSLHDALPISIQHPAMQTVVAKELGPKTELPAAVSIPGATGSWEKSGLDRKSTRLNSSHVRISYAVFCLQNKHTTCYDLHDTPHRQHCDLCAS